jgi:hypothetical protein
MDSEFRRACFVFIERKGPRILIAAVYNHDGLWAEQPDGVIQVENIEPTLLGEAIKAQLKKCIHKPSFNYRDQKKTDWPAFQASGARSTTAFEKAFARYWVGGANEANIILIAEPRRSTEHSSFVQASMRMRIHKSWASGCCNCTRTTFGSKRCSNER